MFELLLLIPILFNLGSASKPEILIQPQDALIRTSSFTVFCIKSKGTIVTWYRGGQEVDFRKHLDFQITSDGSLHVTNARRSRDQGLYMCSLTNSQGKVVNSRVAMIQFPYLNEFTVGDWNAAKVEGKSEILRCKPPASYPQGTIKWYKNDPSAPGGRRAMQDSSYYTISQSGDIHFAYLRHTDAGYYTCTVSNSVLKRQESRTVVLSVTRVPSLISQPPVVSPEFSQTKTAMKGERFVLECVVYGMPVPRVTLRKKGEHVLRGQTKGNLHTLVINSFTKDDAGKYKCKATDSAARQDSRITYVKMEAKPEWVVKPEDITRGISSSITINCQGYGIPALLYTWYFNGQRLHPSDKITLRAGSITIHGLTYADAGMYQCIPKNMHGHLYSAIELKVAEIPAGFGPGSKAPLKKQEALIHTTTELPCHPTGAPRPKVRWRAGLIYISSGGRIQILPNGNLRIYNVSKADARTYTCEVSNRIGSDSRSSQLTVLDRFAITEQPVNTKVVLGGNVTLPCGVLTMLNSSREVGLGWHRFFDNIYPTDRIKLKSVALPPVNSMIKKRLTMIIQNIKYSDQGLYTCRATLSGKTLKTSQVHAFITVQGPPDPPTSVHIGKVNINTWRMNITWVLGASNNSPIIKVIVEYSTKFQPTVWKVATEINDPMQRSVELMLNPGVEYTFRVISVNSVGNSTPNKVYTSIQTPPTAPTSVPTNIRVKGVQPSSLQITWQPLPHENQNGPGIYYIIYYKKSGSNEGMTRREIRNSNSFAITGTKYNEEYQVQIQVANNFGFGPKSRIITGQTGDAADVTPNPSSVTAPADAPTNLEIIVHSATMAYAKWTGIPNGVQSTQGKLLGYKVYFWRAPSGQKHKESMFKSTSETSAHLQLEAYTSYRFQVVAYNSVGDGPGSNVVGPLTTPETIPGQPRILTLNTQNNSDVLLDWNPPQTPNGILTGYKVAVQELPSGKVQITEEIEGETSLWLQGLQKSNTYKFSVKAVNSVGESPPVLAVFDLATAPEQPPARYVTVAFDNMAQEATITWKAWTYLNEIDGYRIFYGVPGQDFQTIDVNKYTTRDTIYGLRKDTQYYFQVAAFKTVGISHFLVGAKSQAVVVGKVNIAARKDSGSSSTHSTEQRLLWMMMCAALVRLFSP